MLTNEGFHVVNIRRDRYTDTALGDQRAALRRQRADRFGHPQKRDTRAAVLACGGKFELRRGTRAPGQRHNKRRRANVHMVSAPSPRGTIAIVRAGKLRIDRKRNRGIRPRAIRQHPDTAPRSVGNPAESAPNRLHYPPTSPGEKVTPHRRDTLSKRFGQIGMLVRSTTHHTDNRQSIHEQAPSCPPHR